jgi:hypothetical protein
MSMIATKGLLIQLGLSIFNTGIKKLIKKIEKKHKDTDIEKLAEQIEKLEQMRNEAIEKLKIAALENSINLENFIAQDKAVDDNDGWKVVKNDDTE